MAIGDNLIFYMRRAQVGPRALSKMTRDIDLVGREGRDGKRLFGVSESLILKLRAGHRGSLTSGSILELLAKALGVRSDNLLSDNQVATAMASKHRLETAVRCAPQREAGLRLRSGKV